MAWTWANPRRCAPSFRPSSSNGSPSPHKQYASLKRQAAEQRALAPDGHPQLLRLRAIAARLVPYSKRFNLKLMPMSWGWTSRRGQDSIRAPALTLWQKMTQAGKGRPPLWLSTHPSGPNRIKEMEKHLPEVLPLYERSARRAGAHPPAPVQAR